MGVASAPGGGGLFKRPQTPDQFANQEEANLASLKAEKERKLNEIDLVLDRARERRAQYRAQGKLQDVETQNAIIDRRLAERFEVMNGG